MSAVSKDYLFLMQTEYLTLKGHCKSLKLRVSWHDFDISRLAHYL